MTIKDKKILVIEDEYSIQEMLRDILTGAGFEVIIADNGAEGIQKIYQEYPDIVLLDCIMPEMDGYQVLKFLKTNSETKNIIVVMLTALKMGGEIEVALDLGADWYVTKPFDPKHLLEKIASILEKKKNR